MAGRKPKPTQLKIIEGNPGKRPLNNREPVPTGDLENPPEWLNDSQKEGWKYAIENAPKGLLKKLDQSVLITWVIAEDLHRQATMQLQKTGLLVRTPNTNQPMQSPYLPIINRQATLMMKAASEMGFTPTSRSRIVLAEEALQDDPWAKLANG